MAAKTATICAGHQQNGTGDCVAFYNGLVPKNYTGQAYDIDELCDRIYEIDMGKIIKLRIKGGAK